MKNYVRLIRVTLSQKDFNSTGSIFPLQISFKKIKALALLIIGYLLSPLCWWNDLFFNLPLAYGFGYVCSWFWADVLLPASIVGYWLSNLLGILLMQLGAIDMLQEQSAERNLKKELLSGFLASTAYTVIILLLIQFNILDTPLVY